jgi:endonuclease I
MGRDLKAPGHVRVIDWRGQVSRRGLVMRTRTRLKRFDAQRLMLVIWTEPMPTSEELAKCFVCSKVIEIPAV